jgi:radical SAM protein with 4Fe4S-binding SPASM domain
MIKARLKWHLAKYISFSSPAHIDLELSTKCKLNCEFCFRKEHKYPAKDIDLHLVYDIFKQAKEMRIPSIKFNWRGEALSHPNWPEIFMLFKANGFYTMLNTALADTYSEFELNTLAWTIDNLKVSFDSSAEAIYNRIRKGADFFQTLASLDKLSALRKEHNMPKVILNRRTTKISEPDEAFKEFFGDEVDYDIRPAIERNQQDIYINMLQSGERKYCNQPNRRMVISENGFVYACCVAYALQSELYMGRLGDKSLKEIWNSERRLNLIDNLQHRIYNNACRNCSSMESYK